jgi:hypothetical protein
MCFAHQGDHAVNGFNAAFFPRDRTHLGHGSDYIPGHAHSPLRILI